MPRKPSSAMIRNILLTWLYTLVYTYRMNVNALKIRNEFGAVLETLKELGEPIIIEKNRTPVAVLISLEDFQNRFIDYKETEKKKEVISLFRKNLVKSKKNSLKELRKVRYD